MIRQFSPRAVVETVDSVLATNPVEQPEPAEYASKIENGDPHTICIQRARFGHTPTAEETHGQILVDVSIPYEQFPTTEHIIPDDKGVINMDVDLPPGTNSEDIRVADEPTVLSTVGFEHKQFATQLLTLFHDIPVADQENSDSQFECLAIDGEAATFSAIINLEQTFDPSIPIPETLRRPIRRRESV